MQQIKTIGIDLAKNVFQVHGVDASEEVVVARQLRHNQVVPFFEKLEPCLVGMEAYATAHHWARDLIRLGHDVQLIPPVYVKAYVKRGKNDAADAAAICEAVTRPSMRFVPVKTEEQQASLAVHRARDLLMRQRTQLTNALRAHLAELGIITATAMAVTVTDPGQFKSGLDLAAWIGLVPKQNSTGGKVKLGGISKQGDRYLRRLLVVGGTSVVKLTKIFPWRYPWVAKLLEKKPAKVVAVAVANKLVRVAWAVTNSGGTYRPQLRGACPWWAWREATEATPVRIFTLRG